MLFNAVKSKDVDRLKTNITWQRSQHSDESEQAPTRSSRFEIQNSLNDIELYLYLFIFSPRRI